MHTVIEGKSVYVVEFDTMPELPITGLTRGEQVYRDALYIASYPTGPRGTLGGDRELSRPTIAQALTDAFQKGIITEPGKYGVHFVPGTYNYEIYEIIE